MAEYSLDVKEQIRQAVDITELTSRYMELRRQGSQYVALCPWHDDTKPSLTINPQRQSWKCWVCDIGGDIFSFIMKKESLTFPEALEFLAQEANIPLQLSGGRGNSHKKEMFSCASWVAQRFHQCLLKSAEAQIARDYLEQRGITHQSLIRFQVGFSPNDWHWLSRQVADSGFSERHFDTIGMLGKSETSSQYYDRFRGRVIFPIQDTQSRTIAFGGRILPEYSDKNPAKYINSPETPLFKKQEQFYGLNLAKETIGKEKRALVMEGYTDVIMAHQFGLTESIAVLGTALGPKHLQVLKRYAEEVILVLDGDEAGQKRTNEILELFISQQFNLKVLTLPEGQDPCDFLQREGAEAFRDLLTTARDALDHKVFISTQNIDLQASTHDSNLALGEILSTLAKAPRLQGMTPSESQIREQQILTRLSRKFRIEEGILRDRLQELRVRKKNSQKDYTPENQGIQDTPVRLSKTEEELLGILLSEPNQIPAILGSTQGINVGSPFCQKVLYLCQEYHRQNKAVDFHLLMNLLDDPREKKLIVQLDEQAAKKSRTALFNPEVRLKELFSFLQEQNQRQKTKQELTQLDFAGEDQQLSVFQLILEQQRNKRQEDPDF
ncbi:MAG: DNA primase [Pirellulaceae bacterium]|nr:DNA primase [Pirellulaceae bacterium]